ncbi:DegV family protein [Bacillus sp. FJAT-45350]|uniref:DegV family protein n=1 Tax=Bacillus sp. FJAT-45350 TaxID=2011014 RepID=UPI000BB7CE4D|nr:DegV family protein [Bacillus sp. FJAT-45350]
MTKKIKIVTDSTVDLPQEIINQFGITVVPLTITIDGTSYLDQVELGSHEFIAKLKASKELPKTSQPSAGSFAEVYEKLGEDGSEILSIHITEGMSGTASSARAAAEMVEADVTVVNSRFISFACAFQVLEAAKMAENGSTMEEIVARLDEIRSNTTLYIMVDTLEYLIKGGRIGKMQALLGSLLKIKPVAAMPDGALVSATKVRTHSQLVKFYLNQLLEDAKGKTIKGIGIAHADSKELSEKIKAEIEEQTGFTETMIVDTTPVISAHAGPGAVALMYYAE